MQDLKNTNIGGKDITLRRVPASKARGLQTTLLSLIGEPLADIFAGQSSGAPLGEQIIAGMAAFLPKLNDTELTSLIDKCKPFIMVDGKPFDEDSQFDSDSLFDMYQVLWYFLKETFEGFISAVLSHSQKVPMMTALKK